jgi:hypothetical protein
LLARWCGIEGTDAVNPRELVDRFDLSRMPQSAITFNRQDDEWLLTGR